MRRIKWWPTPAMAVAGVCAGFLVASTQASAHPHVWVDVKTTVAYEEGRIKGFWHHWTFDDMYTAMAIQGLDKDGDGIYTREELAELAQVNIDGLSQFDYFTFPKLGESDLAIGAPHEYWLEHKDGILTLHFLLPIAEPILADAEGFSFKVYDPTYFIAFDLAKKDPIILGAGAPPTCGVDVGVPPAERAQAEQLGESFFQQLGGDFGISLAQTISVVCSKT